MSSDPSQNKRPSPDVGPTQSQAEGEREKVDEALDRAAETAVKSGHRADRTPSTSSSPVAGANEGKSVEDAKKGKRSQAA